MNINDKRYPYPVLTPNGDDYDKGEFDIDLEVEKTPDDVTLTLSPTLKDDELRRLIGVERKAKIIVHVESPKTVFRRTYDVAMPVCGKASEQENTVVKINAADLSGTVSVCPFIVATEDIPDYSNESFNPDYEGEAFSIDCGAVLAEGRQRTFVANTAREALATVASIFSVVKNISPDCRTLRNDFTGDKIRIEMPEKMFSQYGTLKDTPEDKDTIWAMVFVPALVEVLTTVAAERRCNNGEMPSDFMERAWYRSIDKTLRGMKGWGLDSDKFSNGNDYLELASLLVKNSVSKAFLNMVTVHYNED
jgi:hypothetical protein